MPAAVAPDAGAMVTPVAVVVAPKVQPPAGVAPAIEPAGAVLGTTCLTTDTEPLQEPRASARSALPAAV